MRRLLIILAFTFVVVLIHDVNCQTSSSSTKQPIKGNVETTYHPHQFYTSNSGAVVPQPKELFYYNNQPTTSQGQVPASLESSKQAPPSTVLYRDITSHYQTIPQRPTNYNIQTVAATSHVPSLTTNEHGLVILSPVNQHAGYYQPTNQYSVAQSPFVESSIRQPQVVGTGPVQFYNTPAPAAAYTQYHHLPSGLHQSHHPIISYQKQQLLSQHTNPSPKIQPIETRKPLLPTSDFQFKTPPLFQHHVYHPLHTSVKHPQQQINNYRPGPPTPPRYYKVFTPMIPRKVIPVSEHPVQQNQANRNVEEEEKDEEEDKAEVNEEEDDEDERENEKIEEDEDDDHSDVKEDEEDSFGPGPNFGFSGKIRHNDDDDDDDDDPRHYSSRYRHHQQDDDDHDSADTNTKEKKKNFQPKYKYKYPVLKDFTSHFNPAFYEHKASAGPASNSKPPKIEVKMYKYTRSSNEPQKRENIQGKGSELKPVVEHNQKTVQSKWIISTKTSSSSNN